MHKKNFDNKLKSPSYYFTELIDLVACGIEYREMS